MLIMYWLSDGEIYHVITGYKTIEEFNAKRAEEFKKIYGFLYVAEVSDFVINRYPDFKVDLEAPEGPSLIYVGEALPYKVLTR